MHARTIGAANGRLTLAVALVLALSAVLLVPTIAQARPGALDRSFGDDGKVRNFFCGHARHFDVVIDAHQRIVTAGTDNSAVRLCVARFRRNGSIDRSFSSNGKVVTRLGGVAAGFSVELDGHRRIVVAGGYGGPARNHVNEFAVARFKPNGSFDPSFGDGGTVMTRIGRRATASSVAIDSHDRIVAAGYGYSEGDRDFALARYRRDGSLDPSFGSDGTLTTELGSTDVASSMAIDSPGRMVVAGISYGNEGFILARYRRNGSLDPLFGAGGIVTTPFQGAANSVAIDWRGRILAAGSSDRDFALARYEPDGSLDPSFSSNGKVTTDVGAGGASAVTIDSRHRLVAAGGSFDLVRYRSNGRLDRRFGRRGKVITENRFRAEVSSAAIDPRDRIVVVGDHADLVLGRWLGYPH